MHTLEYEDRSHARDVLAEMNGRFSILRLRHTGQTLHEPWPKHSRFAGAGVMLTPRRTCCAEVFGDEVAQSSRRVLVLP
jgi:hypothetical protein